MGRRMELSDNINVTAISSRTNRTNRVLEVRTKEEIGAEVRQRQAIMKSIEKAMKIGK